MIAGIAWWVICPVIWPFGVLVCWLLLLAAAEGYRWHVRRTVRRRAAHDAAVEKAKAAGYAAGEAAAFGGQWVEVDDQPLVPFRARRPRRERREATATNCTRAWGASFLRGHAACTRAKLDVEADERIADGIERLQAIANGERAG